MRRIVGLVAMLLLAAGVSLAQPPPPPKPPIEREMERAKEQAVRDVIWTLRSMARRAVRNATR